MTQKPLNDADFEPLNDTDFGDREEDDSLDKHPPRDRVLTFLVPPNVTGRLDSWLASQCEELTRARIQMLVKDGRVTCGERALKSSSRPEVGQIITITIPAPVPTTPQPENIPLNLIYEDRDIIVLNKPAGMVIHPACGHSTGTLVNALLYHCSDLGGIGGVERPGIVHRLDKDTSGVMVVAKNEKTLTALMYLFKACGVRKEYLALTHGVPQKLSGSIRTLIARHQVDRKRMAVSATNGKEAITHYSVEQRLKGNLALMRCRIETGRTHQIRVHLHFMGTPLVGDSVYGRAAADRLLPCKPERQMLHATHLAFTHPVKKISMNFTAPLPLDFQHLLDVMQLEP